jgi:WD40-like Beta Propeller Repeat
MGVVLGAGCGRLGFAPLDADPNGDAGAAMSDGVDRCADEKVVLGTWSAPVVMAGLNSGSVDEDPTMSVDRLEIFFISARSGNADIWRATRPTATSAWNPPAIVAELMDPMPDSTPELSPDGLTLWFSSMRAGSVGSDDIWMSTRSVVGGAWTPAVRVPELSSVATDRGAALFDDGLAILIHSGRPGGVGLNDFYVATRATAANAWSTPVSLGSPPNSTGSEQHGWISNCGLYLVFHRTGGSGADLFVTSRSTVDDVFSPPAAISELNVLNLDDKDLKLSPDRRYGYFVSDRAGNADLYEITR